MDLEELVLSGALFSDRSTSPVRSPPHSRSPSPDPLWPSNGDSSGSDLDFSPSASTSNLRNVPAETPQPQMGSGRTGVKSVLQDRNEAVSLANAQRIQDIKATNRRMEKMALTGRTYAQDEEERLRENASVNGSNEEGSKMFKRTGKFGYLREVDHDGFLNAIDDELHGTWVVIHVYDPSLPRCHDLDSVLARLARQHPQTKFLRARASALNFLSLSATRSAASSSSTPHPDSNLITISEKFSYSDEDDDDAYLYDDVEDIQDATDTDMLPTLLAYRSGELVHTWVRVDWEVAAWSKRGGKDANGSGIEGLLQGHYIIQPSSNGNCGFSSDEDDDLEFVQDGGDGDNDDDLFDL